MLLHPFDNTARGIAPPERFTFPFNYLPHPLVVAARRIALERGLLEPLMPWLRDEGKMLGVLVCRGTEGDLGFLLAFSGNVGGRNVFPGFVPPVADLLDPQGMFKRGESAISAINGEIAALESGNELRALLLRRDEALAQRNEAVEAFRERMSRSKRERDAARGRGNADEEALKAQSQWEKAEMRRIKAKHAAIVTECEAALRSMQQRIGALKAKRKSMSEALQRRLFEMYVVSNARGDTRNVLEIFADAGLGMPPAGTGECAAPKLLDYAYKHELTPLCMGEFWAGNDNRDGMRRQGNFYPACRSKCLPLLNFMMQGLDVDDDPHSRDTRHLAVTIVHDDPHLAIVDKPAGMLSVAGKVNSDSLEARLKTLFPDCKEAAVAHRLDRDTSGLVVVAKSKAVLAMMHRLFENRQVRKTYVAVLDGAPKNDEGIISLPLRHDTDDRPRQVADRKHGNEAVTIYRVTKRQRNADGSETARVTLQPLTGRTHQLRVHAAHAAGLNAPIHGDNIYGTPDKRLLLHATSISFTHPVTNEMINANSKPPF